MLEVMAAASLGLAVAFASWSVAETIDVVARAALALAAAAAAFLLAVRLLVDFANQPLSVQAANECQPATPSALLIRLQDVLAEASAAEKGADELLLDDPLPDAEPGSRVVQLFDAPLLPTAGELQSRIDRHLVSRGGAQPSADHSDELFEALESLKRSLG
jgi:hypothetical protein